MSLRKSTDKYSSTMPFRPISRPVTAAVLLSTLIACAVIRTTNASDPKSEQFCGELSSLHHYKEATRLICPSCSRFVHFFPAYASEGVSWTDAFENCHEHCPNGDSDCTNPGHTCHGYTACVPKVEDAGGGGGGQANAGATSFFPEAPAVPSQYANHFCGLTWNHAHLTCKNPCPPGTTCPSGETCFEATNCDRPLEPISSDMVMSLLGNYAGAVNMGAAEKGVFSDSVLSFLMEKMEENSVAIKGADVTGQNFQADRRALEWNDTATGSSGTVELSFGQIRRLPTSSSALDVSMTITGDYRREWLNLGVIRCFDLLLLIEFVANALALFAFQLHPTKMLIS